MAPNEKYTPSGPSEATGVSRSLLVAFLDDWIWDFVTETLVLLSLMRSFLGSACLSLLFSISLAAQTRPQPSTPSTFATFIRCGTLIDGISTAQRKNILLRLDGNKIVGLTSFSPSAALRSPPRTIDLSNETCLPGLIDVHVHVIRQDPKRRERQTPSESLSAENLRRTLNYGFTTVRASAQPLWAHPILMCKTPLRRNCWWDLGSRLPFVTSTPGISG